MMLKSGLFSVLKIVQFLFDNDHPKDHFSIIEIDGLSMGDGTEIGKCPSSFSSYKCLSTGACNVCGLISGNAEGCDITSTTPVCDADSSLSGTQDSASPGKVAECVGCTKSGKWT